jgi:hypothetical protein
MRKTRTTAQLLGTGLAAGALLFVPACGDDEDGDGGVTDEELQELEDQGEQIGDQLEEEVDAQDEGSNDDGE